jgi:hypothetical protein
MLEGLQHAWEACGESQPGASTIYSPSIECWNWLLVAYVAACTGIVAEATSAEGNDIDSSPQGKQPQFPSSTHLQNPIFDDYQCVRACLAPLTVHVCNASEPLSRYSASMSSPALCLMVIVSLGLAGCTKPYSARSNLRLTESEQRQKPVLDGKDQNLAVAVLRSLADGHSQVETPGPAPDGIRWSDVPLAVRHACIDAEMAIAREHLTADEAYYLLTTIDERPAELIITRGEGGSSYTANATVGRFGCDTATAREIIEALRRSMRDLGKKRAFN